IGCGYLIVPWTVDGAGRLMGSSATLIERPQPYRIGVELARGKLNQLRGQAADWRAVGLQIPDSLDDHIRAASRHFGRAATSPADDEADDQAREALEQSYRSAANLVHTYADQIYRAR